MECKEIKLKSEDGWDELELTLWEDGSVSISTDPDGLTGVCTTKEKIKEFATKILKELDNGISN